MPASLDAHEVLVLGGGPAGSMAALALARAGRACRLIERSDEIPDRACGDFLSTEAVQRLERLGFPWASAQAGSVRAIQIQGRGRSVTARLPFEGRSVRRGFLDGWLLEAASRDGARVETGIRARAVNRIVGGFEVDCGNEQIRATTLILATGKHGLGAFHPRPTARVLAGWKMSFRHLGPSLSRALDQTICLFAFAGGYGGICRVADDTATVALLTNPALLRGGHPDCIAPLRSMAEEAPLLAQLLAESEPAWEKPKTVANLPYGHCDAQCEPGLFAVGDQFAVLPSFTGTGVSFAMASGAAAARHILGSPAPVAALRYAEQTRRLARPVLRVAMPLHRLLQDPTFVGLAMRLLDAMPGVLPGLARRTRLPKLALNEMP